MDPNDFLKLLVNSKGIIGNSSVGIRECAFLGVSSVNIGNRQSRRTRSKNVIDVSYSREKIKLALKTIIQNGKSPSSTIFGKGESGNKIARILSQLPLKVDKQIQY